MGLFGGEKERASSKRNPAEESRWGFASFVDRKEGKKVKKVYGLWGAMKYTMILSLLLWWLPVFGQMVAGYVGGRKAGGPIKGVIAAVIPVAALFAVMTAIDHFLTQGISGSGSASATLIAGLATGMPVIGPYLEFTRNYVMRFIDSLAGSSPYGLNSYIITLAFAYIGGILAAQTRREIEAVSGEAGSRTTVVVAPNERPSDGADRNHPSNHNPIQQVGSFISGKMSPLRHPYGHGKAAKAKSFDGMVAIRDVEGAEMEDEIAPPADAEDVHETKQVKRKVRKLKAKPNAKPVREATVRQERPNMVVSANRPNTFRTAQRRIEREWDPQRKMRATHSPPPLAVPRHQARHDAAVAQVHQQPVPSVARRPPVRNYDTI